MLSKSPGGFLYLIFTFCFFFSNWMGGEKKKKKKRAMWKVLKVEMMK